MRSTTRAVFSDVCFFILIDGARPVRPGFDEVGEDKGSMAECDLPDLDAGCRLVTPRVTGVCLETGFCRETGTDADSRRCMVVGRPLWLAPDSLDGGACVRNGRGMVLVVSGRWNFLVSAAETAGLVVLFPMKYCFIGSFDNEDFVFDNAASALARTMATSSSTEAADCFRAPKAKLREFGREYILREKLEQFKKRILVE